MAMLAKCVARRTADAAGRKPRRQLVCILAAKSVIERRLQLYPKVKCPLWLENAEALDSFQRIQEQIASLRVFPSHFQQVTLWPTQGSKRSPLRQTVYAINGTAKQ